MPGESPGMGRDLAVAPPEPPYIGRIGLFDPDTLARRGHDQGFRSTTPEYVSPIYLLPPRYPATTRPKHKIQQPVSLWKRQSMTLCDGSR